jgi:hypothetical protein
VLFGRPNLNFRTKFDQIFDFPKKKNAKFPKFSRFRLVNHLPVPTEMGEIQIPTQYTLFTTTACPHDMVGSASCQG